MERLNLFQQRAKEKIGLLICLDCDEKMLSERLVTRGRADDTPEPISARNRVWEEETSLVVSHLGWLGKDVVPTYRVDSSLSLESIRQALRRIMEEHEVLLRPHDEERAVPEMVMPENSGHGIELVPEKATSENGLIAKEAVVLKDAMVDKDIAAEEVEEEAASESASESAPSS